MARPSPVLQDLSTSKNPDDCYPYLLFIQKSILLKIGVCTHCRLPIVRRCVSFPQSQVDRLYRTDSNTAHARGGLHRVADRPVVYIHPILGGCRGGMSCR